MEIKQPMAMTNKDGTQRREGLTVAAVVEAVAESGRPGRDGRLRLHHEGGLGAAGRTPGVPARDAAHWDDGGRRRLRMHREGGRGAFWSALMVPSRAAAHGDGGVRRRLRLHREGGRGAIGCAAHGGRRGLALLRLGIHGSRRRAEPLVSARHQQETKPTHRGEGSEWWRAICAPGSARVFIGWGVADATVTCNFSGAASLPAMATCNFPADT